MKIVYAKTTTEEIDKERSDARRAETSFADVSLLLLYALLWGLRILLCMILLSIALSPGAISCLDKFKCVLQIEKTGLAIDFLYLLMVGLLIYVIARVIHGLYERAVELLFPTIKKKVRNINKSREFLNRTRELRNEIECQENLKNLLQDKHAGFMVDGKNLEITVENEYGFSEKHELQLTDEQFCRLKEDGILDYSDLDKKWKEVLMERKRYTE